MLHFLFRRLTAEPRRGAEMFAAVTELARAPHWYRAGGVPDTIDGRFAVLASVAALVLVRIEEEGERGNAAAVALTERFIEVMEAEHRELGLGDPALGRTVRKLVGSLARRTGLWRSATRSEIDWGAATRQSLYKAEVAEAAALHAAHALAQLWAALQARQLADIEQGRLG